MSVGGMVRLVTAGLIDKISIHIIGVMKTTITIASRI